MRIPYGGRVFPNLADLEVEVNLRLQIRTVDRDHSDNLEDEPPKKRGRPSVILHINHVALAQYGYRRSSNAVS